MRVDFLVYSTIGPATDMIISILNGSVQGVSGVSAWASRQNCAIQRCIDSGSELIGTVVTPSKLEEFKTYCGEDNRYSLDTAKRILVFQGDILSQAVHLSQLNQFFLLQLVNDEIDFNSISYTFDSDEILANLKSISRGNHLMYADFKASTAGFPMEISYEALQKKTNIISSEVAALLGTAHAPQALRTIMREHEAKHRQILKLKIEEL